MIRKSIAEKQHDRCGPSYTRRVPVAIRVVLLVSLLLFLLFGDTPERTRFWEALFDFGHAPLSGVVALLLRGLLARPTAARGERASLLAFGLTVALGAVVELVQNLQPDREPSWQDLWRDAAGAASFLLLRDAVAVGRSGGDHRPWRAAGGWAAILAGLALLLAASATLARTVAIYAGRNRAVPTLFALDGAWWERALIDEGHSRLTPGPGLARLDLAPGEYPGLTFDEPYPDWRGYRSLALTIVSDLDVPVPMALRVHDAAHTQRFEDRFNRRLLVQPGRNIFRIPLEEIRRAPRGREMDLAHIRGILLFTRRLDHRTHVYLGPLRLER